MVFTHYRKLRNWNKKIFVLNFWIHKACFFKSDFKCSYLTHLLLLQLTQTNLFQVFCLWGVFKISSSPLFRLGVFFLNIHEKGKQFPAQLYFRFVFSNGPVCRLTSSCQYSIILKRKGAPIRVLYILKILPFGTLFCL